MGLKEFLVTTKKGLAELQAHERIHVVIGNESCDLDSTVSAVTYAYFLHETKSKPDTLILPMLNIPRRLFRLRLEISFLLHKHNITQDDLIFVDELDLQALTQAQDVVLSVTLVDHHVVSAGQECLKDFVVEVLDHRPLAGVLPERWSAEVERVGSCCTLVARKMLASETFNLDSAVAELLLGTILMDTGNMSPIDNVGTPSDLEVISQLKAYVPPGTADDLFEGIRKAKADLSSLTVLEMLYKDLKVLRGTHITVAMSSLTAKLEDVMSRPEFADDCAAFCSACPADVLIIMTLWKDGSGSSFRRIAVFSQNRIYREQVKDVLLNSVSPNLELEPMTSYNHIDNISAFFQNNVQVFRKGVAPLIQKFLAGEESTPDENLNAVDNLDQLYPDSPLGSDLLDEVADVSEEEVRKHINLAKAVQSDQFRTSQDWYDLAAVGTDPVISASLSSDSEFSIGDKKKNGGGDDDDNTSDNEVEKKRMVDKSFEFVGGAKMSEDFFVNEKSGAGDGANVDGLVDMKAAVSDGDGLFVNDLIDFEFGGKDSEDIISPPVEVNSDFTQLGDGREQEFLNKLDAPFSMEPEEANQGFLSNSLDAPFNIEPQVDQGSFSDFDVKVSDSRDDTMGDLLSISSDNVDVDSTLVDAKDENNFGDAFQDQSPFNILGPDSVDSPGDIFSMPTSNQTSGQGSKLPSYPETPPNSCMEPSNVIFNKETQLPSFNSSEMVKRIHEKKAALAGYGGKQKTGMFDDEGPLEELLLGGDNSSGGGGSLISPAVPQNSYVDVSRGFEFESSDSQLPTLMDSDIMERVNEKRSQFEWSIESLDGSTSGVDIGPVSEDGERSPFVTDAAQNATISGGIEPQVPYTPQNSYVEENFDSYARANLPSLNNAEIVAKIKAKQSAMFGNHGSSRVSRSSHGSDDSGGCHSPEIVDKSPRGTSLDSPQAPYTPQNSYRDNLSALETRNHLPDLNEVAERLSTENPLKRQFGKRSGSNSGGGSRDEENINLNIHQHGLRHHGRNSSSQSDSQNTMSDVESLMSVSTEVGTPSDNIVASGLANQMRGEIAMLSRKDTDDSDVFSPRKPDNDASEAREVPTPRVSSIDLTFDDAAGYNIVGTVPNGIDTDGGSGGVVRSDSGGVKELFSPYDSEKVQTMEDHALFQAAESIVAQSVAAAVEFSQKETQSSQGRKESRLRWNDDDDDDDDEADNENGYKARRSPTVFYRGDEEEDNDGSDVEDDTVGDISESFPENDLNKMGSEKGSTEDINTPDAYKDMTTGSFENPDFDSDFKSHSVPEQSHSQVDQMEEDSRSQQNPDEDYAQEEELTESLGFSVLDREEQANTSSVPLVSQSITDLTLNELAFELANELIQSVLDDFPFSEYLATIQSEAGARDVGQGVGTVGTQNIRSQGNLSQSSWTPVSSEINTSANNDSDNTAEITDNSGTILASTVSQESAHDPSLSSERKRLKGSDPSLVILEDEMLANFPERKMSSEFSGVEEDEEIIVSFPGRKFSKSEDYPSRRFSRDENSSRFEDSELEVTLGPEDIETSYLPSMDPLQGNLDIFETSFSKITDADREVAEEESFRRASGGGIVSDEEEEEDRISENDEESIKRVDDGESNKVFDVEDDFDNVESENLRRAGGESVNYEEEEEEDRLGENEESSHRVYDSESYRGVGVKDGSDVTQYAGLVEAGRSIPEVREELVSDEEDISEKEDISREASFSKITDVDKEDVEEESIRKASGGGIASDQENEEEDKISDNEEESSEKVFDIESNRVVGVQASNVDVSDAGLVETSRSIPEVIEELVSDEEDFSRELYPQVANNQTEEEDMSRETASGKVTDADGEVVKEDSFRRAGSGDTDEDNEEYRISDIEEEFSQKEDDQDRNSFVGEDDRDRNSFVGEDDRDRNSFVGEDDRDRNRFVGEDDQDRNSFVGEDDRDRNSFVGEDDQDRNSFVGDDDFADMEGGSFRRGIADDEKKAEEDIISDNEQESSEKVDEGETTSVVDVEDAYTVVTHEAGLFEASRSIPEVKEELVSDEEEDISGETSLSKITDADEEAVEEEDFRRAGVAGIVDDEEKEEEDRISDNEKENSYKLDDGDRNRNVNVEDNYTGVNHDARLVEASRSIPEVREELVSDVEEEDFSGEFYSQVAGNRTEEDKSGDFDSQDARSRTEEDRTGDFDSQVTGNRTEEDRTGDFDSQVAGNQTGDDFDSQLNGNQTAGEPFADFSREFPVSATEQLGLEGAVDVSNQLEDEGLEDLDESDTEESDIISQTDRDVQEVSIGMEMQALGRPDVGLFESRDSEAEDVEAEEAEDVEAEEAEDVEAEEAEDVEAEEAEDVEAEEAEDVEAEEAEDAETSSEDGEQTTEHELDLQSEISNVLEVQTALSELEQSVDARHQIEVEISEAARELEIQASVDDLTRVEAPVLEVVPVPKQKKKIRVSFSEDFDDEIGDFNISSSSRSSLKSPPPLPLSGDSESPSPSPSPENINDAAADEEDGVSPLSAAPSRWESQEPAQRKEVYHTSAGRMSISVGEEESTGSTALNSEISPSVVSFTDEIIMKARAHVGDLIESAKGTISEADLQLGDDASLPASSAAVLYSSDVSEPEFTSNTSQLDFSSGTLHSVHDTAIMSEDASNNAFSIVTSDFASFDSTNLDPSAANSNSLNEARVKSLADSCNLELTEPSAVTSEPLTVSEPEPLPAVLAVNSIEDAPFDSLASMPTHVRTLSGASTGSFQGAVYSEEWQDDEFLQVAEQSGLEAEHDDPTRKKIVPEADVAEAAVADNDAEEVEDNEGKKDDDEESDAGDLEWENDTPVKIPTRPGIQPTLTEEETSPEVQRWKRVSVSGSDFDIDLQVVEPFKNVLSHGGYYDEGLSAIIVFYGCNLPSRSREDYAYIMNHLFHYVIHTLEELVADDYVIIYFHGSTPRRQMPSLAWLKRCYQSIDRRLKKNLKGLFLVHPTLWLRTVVMMTKPFISTKFSSKLRFVRTLEELNALVPLTNVTIPDPIVHYDIHHQHLPSPPPSPSHEASSH